MTNKYYEVTGVIDGQKEVLFGSFDKDDCKYEKDAEKDNWRNEGYKSIKIEVRTTEEKPDSEVYGNESVISPEKQVAHCVDTLTRQGHEVEICYCDDDGETEVLHTFPAVEHDQDSIMEGIKKYPRY